MKQLSLLLSVLFLAQISQAQVEKVLFIGNSYTGNNNLPNIVYQVALSTNDTLLVDSYTPGGQRLLNHAVNTNTMNKIFSNDWDHVVLQAQSQEPSFPINQVQTEVFPYATQLCDSIRSNNSCTRPIFYMTWGRENGDALNCAGWPPVCTYEGMDDLLRERYETMGADNESYVSPVGAVWRYVRNNHPSIDLYAADGSHPSQAGSYLAACTFYTIILEKDPSLISYDYTLSTADAATIRAAAKAVAFDSLAHWNVGAYDPVADFTSSETNGVFNFANNSTYATTYAWDFGDGNTSTMANPQHTYATSGQYTVTLIAEQCGVMDTFSSTVTYSTLTLNTTATNVSCNGGSDGTATATATGGSNTYTYAWSDGQTTATATGLMAGSYSVTINDGISTMTETISVSEPTTLSIIGSTTDESSAGANDGSIDLVVSGGTPPYTYLWSDGSTTEDLTNISGTSYTVTITDANNCTITETYSVLVSIDNLESNQQIVLYPNPAKDVLTLQAEITSGTIRIYGITGVLVLEEQMNTSNGIYLLDINHLNTGQYILELQEGDQTYRQKWTKE